MKALILSGGAGTRLRPITYSQAKQLVPVANKPILFHIIEKVVAAGITDIGIIVGSTGKEVREAVGSGERWGAAVTYIEQLLPLGLAHAVKTASDFLGESRFLMILGDNLFHMELGDFLRDFEESGANGSILLHRVGDPRGFGVAVVEDGMIQRLAEKPDRIISDLIITGIYLFDHTIFRAIDEISPSPRGELEITDAIQRLLDTGGKVTYQLISGWWKDTGKLQDILEANRLVLDGLGAPGREEDPQDAPCSGKIFLGENVLLDSSTLCGPVIIGKNCRIEGSRIGPYVSLGDNVTVTGCSLDNSIILEDSALKNIPRRVTMSLVGRHATISGSGDAGHPAGFFTGDHTTVLF